MSTTKKPSLEERSRRVVALIAISEDVVRSSRLVPARLKRTYLADCGAYRAEVDALLAARRGAQLSQLEAEIASRAEYDAVQDGLVIWRQERRIDDPTAARLSRMLGAYERRAMRRRER